MKGHESGDEDQVDRGFSGSRRKVLKAMGGTAAASVLPFPAVHASSKIRIGYVSPRTGAIAVFAEPDPFILHEMREVLKNGITVGGKRYAAEIMYKDTQSDPSRAATVTSDLILKDKVDIVVAASTPITTVPVANQCELHGVPCVTTDTPWESWYNGRGGDVTDPGQGFNWTWHFFWGAGDNRKVFEGIWGQVSTNKVVGSLWPNDIDGRSRADSFPEAIKGEGYELVDRGRFQLPTDNFSSYISDFKKNGVEIVTGVVPPPDFARFWTQAGQQGFQPSVVTVAKALEFPMVIESLGDRGDRLCVEVWWSPHYPFESSLTGQSAREFASEYSEFSGNRWTMALGFKHSLFEVAINALRKAGERSPDAIRDAIKNTDLKTITGPINFANGPVPNVCTTPLTGGQWRQEGDHKELKIVENSLAPEIDKQAKVELIKYA